MKIQLYLTKQDKHYTNANNKFPLIEKATTDGKATTSLQTPKQSNHTVIFSVFREACNLTAYTLQTSHSNCYE